MTRSGRSRNCCAVLAGSPLLGMTTACTGARWSETRDGDVRRVTHRGGPTLGYSATSGLSLLFDDDTHKPWVLDHEGVVFHFYCAAGTGGRAIAVATSKDLRSPAPAARHARRR